MDSLVCHLFLQYKKNTFSFCCPLKIILKTKSKAYVVDSPSTLSLTALAEVCICICAFLYNKPEGLVANFKLRSTEGIYIISFREDHVHLCFLRVHLLLHSLDSLLNTVLRYQETGKITGSCPHSYFSFLLLP